MPVERLGHILVVTAPLRSVDFITQFNGAVQLGLDEIHIDATGISASLTPHVEVPIAATIDAHKQQGVSVTLEPSRVIPKFQSALFPVRQFAVSKVCEFDHETAAPLVQSIIDSLTGQATFAAGNIDALTWCLWEIMDNVANHSEARCGFVEVQLHLKSKRIAICIADAGRGIRNSLSERRKTSSDQEAISRAMDRKYTRNPGTFQGNGLWGLTEFVKAGRGSLTISSGTGYVAIGRDATGRPIDNQGTGSVWATHDSPGTIVDFQLSYARTIDYQSVVGHAPVVDFSDKILNSSHKYVLRVSSEARGYATRKSGNDMYNRTINYLNAIGGSIELDFGSITGISSSFADEFIGKLVKNMSFIQFNERVRITNTVPNVARMIDRAVHLRLAERSAVSPVD